MLFPFSLSQKPISSIDKRLPSHYFILHFCSLSLLSYSPSSINPPLISTPSLESSVKARHHGLHLRYIIHPRSRRIDLIIHFVIMYLIHVSAIWTQDCRDQSQHDQLYSSKIFIYLFLMEKIYVVTAVGVTRFNFMLYRINLALLLPYVGIFALMIVFRVSEVKENGHCMIGLLPPASVTLILYDIFISSWLTMLFIRPLMSSTSLLQGPSKGRLRDVARRTLVGSLISLVLSTANVFTLVLFKGQERGLICLASCTVDVTLNAMSVHWVTSRGTGRLTSSNNHNIERSSADRRHHLSTQTNSEKQVAPLESHASVTVERYVEQYHQQTSIGSSSSPSY